jgi:hypothetical protein
VSAQIPDKNLFMMCERLNSNAISDMPIGFHVRTCQKNELDIWKAMSGAGVWGLFCITAYLLKLHLSLIQLFLAAFFYPENFKSYADMQNRPNHLLMFPRDCKASSARSKV